MSLWGADQFGPFHYDTEGTGSLWVELPLRDAVVLEKLRGTRQLGEKEIEVVQKLYLAPRATLAPFAFIFDNFSAAADRLIREPSEKTRFEFFQGQFACSIIAARTGSVAGGWDMAIPFYRSCTSSSAGLFVIIVLSILIIVTSHSCQHSHQHCHLSSSVASLSINV